MLIFRGVNASVIGHAVDIHNMKHILFWTILGVFWIDYQRIVPGDTLVYQMVPTWSLTVRPWKVTGTQKERIVFQASIFRRKLAVKPRGWCFTLGRNCFFSCFESRGFPSCRLFEGKDTSWYFPWLFSFWVESIGKKDFQGRPLGKSKPLPIWGLFFKDEVFGTFELGVFWLRTLAYEDRYHWNHCMMTLVFSWSGVSLITENESYWTCYTYLDVTALPSQHFSFFEGIKWKKKTTTHQTCCDLTTLPSPFQKVSHLGKRNKHMSPVNTCCDLILANHEKTHGSRRPFDWSQLPSPRNAVKAWNSEKGFGFCSVSWWTIRISSGVGGCWGCWYKFF